MTAGFINSVRSEWLKKKNTTANWLMVVGAVLVPMVLLLAGFRNPDQLRQSVLDPVYWNTWYYRSWQFMANFVLPVGVMFASSLVAQVEYRNNTWKQVLALPQSYAQIFFAKLLVLLVMLAFFFVFFVLAIYVAAILPSLLVPGVRWPVQPFPVKMFVDGTARFAVASLPIVGLQYLLSVHFRNFLIPLAIGFGLYVLSMIGLSWEYGYTIPYIYCSLVFLGRHATGPLPVSVLATGYFMIFIAAGFLMFRFRRQKG